MKNLAAALVCLSLAAHGQELWTTQIIRGGTRYEDIFFVDENTGWTVDGIYHKVHSTTNGGKTWLQSSSFEKYLRCIEFMNPAVGLIGSLDSSLYRTTDGGITWTDVAPGISPRPKGVCGLAKADANTIYGVGIWSEPAFVIKSTDQGEHWTYTDMSAHATSLVDVFFFDSDHGFITGSNGNNGGIILYTADGGLTWEEKIHTGGITDRVWKIQTPDNKHFYGSVEAFGTDPTRIIRSSDAGQHWEVVTVHPDYYYCQAVGFIDSLRGWTGANANLFETKNGGQTWKKITLGSTYNRFLKISDKTAFLTGNKIYRFDRQVITGVKDPTPYDPVHSVTAAPNPTRGDAVAHVTFGTKTMAHIYVYSVGGKSLKRLYAGYVEAGDRDFPLELADQASQTFIVVVKTNEGMVSTQVIKN